MTGDRDSVAAAAKQHNLKMASRSRLEISGVEDVSSFDEQGIILSSSMGGISVEGEGLKIETFSTTSGDLVITGKVNGIFYFSLGKNSGADKEKTGFFSRLFK